MELATNKQTFAIFCITGYDVRDCKLTKDQASKLIDHLKHGGVFEANKYPLAIFKRVANKTDWQAVYNKALEAGLQAMNKCKPTPMIVQQHKNMSDDTSPVEKSYYVEGGVCGYAWVTISPGTCSFARWLTKNDLGGKDYYGGTTIGAHAGGQSLERNLAYANGIAGILRKELPGNIIVSVNHRVD